MLIFDIETDGFVDQMTVIHCLHIKDTATGKRMRFSSGVYADGTPARRDGSIEEGIALLEAADDIVGHNILSFDNRAIRKLHPTFAPRGTLHDTLVYARLIWTNLMDIDVTAMKECRRGPGFTPKMMGSNSLEAWGHRLNVFKGDYSIARKAEALILGLDEEQTHAYVWGSFNKDMDDYCEQDNEGCEALLDLILSKEYSPEALRLEMDTAEIIVAQEATGFLFNDKAAMALVAELSGIRAGLEDELRTTFAPWYEPKLYKGENVVLHPKVNNKALGYVPGQPLTKIELTVFNPGSRHHAANRMKVLFGWVPTEMTPSGEPKVDEDTLGGLPYPEAKLLVRYLTVQKRLGQIAEGKAAWLKHQKPDGRIYGRVNPNGTRTGRMTHFSPNLAQVPKVGSLWGEECRSFFRVPDGYRLVGCDAEGLELRTLAHYMARFDGGAYGRAVDSGDKALGTDVHTLNMRVVGLNSRDSAKTFIYAYLYGAGSPKLGAVMYDDMDEASKAAFNVRIQRAEAKARASGQDPSDVRIHALRRLGLAARNRIETGLPALGQLQEVVKEKAQRGFLKGIDGRILYNYSAHASLNTLLQGCGAIVMKKALVLCKQSFDAIGWTHGVEYSFVANVHDEWQLEVMAAHAETAGQLSADAIRDAGLHFNLMCPLAGAYQIGLDWAASH